MWSIGRPLPLAHIRQTLVAELSINALFRPIIRGAVGQLVDRLGTPIGGPACAPTGGTFLVRCGFLYRRRQGEADRLYIPAAGSLRAQVLRE
jgi:hypothetical protein